MVWKAFCGVFVVCREILIDQIIFSKINRDRKPSSRSITDNSSHFLTTLIHITARKRDGGPKAIDGGDGQRKLAPL